MSKVKEIQIYCINCGEWFPTPASWLGDSETLDIATLEGKQAVCPLCGKMIVCDKDNMRVVLENGGFSDNKT